MKIVLSPQLARKVYQRHQELQREPKYVKEYSGLNSITLARLFGRERSWVIFGIMVGS